MALDLTRTAIQIDDMAAALRAGHADRGLRLSSALDAARSFDPTEYMTKRAQPGTDLNWIVPEIYDRLDVSYSPPPLPDDFCVVGVDGSHIDVSRHIPAHCYLINIGGILLRYGSKSDAQVFSSPRLYANEDELVIRDRFAPYREETISGALLDAKRAVEELRGLLDTLSELPPDVPALGLVDGSLIMFGMHRHPEFVVRHLVDEGYVEIMDEIMRMVIRAHTGNRKLHQSAPQHGSCERAAGERVPLPYRGLRSRVRHHPERRASLRQGSERRSRQGDIQ